MMSLSYFDKDIGFVSFFYSIFFRAKFAKTLENQKDLKIKFDC